MKQQKKCQIGKAKVAIFGEYCSCEERGDHRRFSEGLIRRGATDQAVRDVVTGGRRTPLNDWQCEVYKLGPITFCVKRYHANASNFWDL